LTLAATVWSASMLGPVCIPVRLFREKTPTERPSVQAEIS
jgi:hypothetical protein